MRVHASDIDKPPAPWGPIRVEGPRLLLTDKAITLDPDGLPAQIEIQGEPILASKLTLTVDGRPLLTDRAVLPPQSLNTSADEVDYQVPVQIPTDASSVRCQIHVAVTFDALLALDLSCPAHAGALAAKRLVLRVDFNPGAAHFLHRWGEVGQRNVDLSTSSSDVIHSAYVPFLWLGNDRNGLIWFCESTAGWDNADQLNAISVVRTGQRWNLVVTIRPALGSDGSWSYHFGLMPTPVKPLPANWRHWRFLPASRGNTYVIWPDERDAQMEYFGYPATRSPDRLSGYIRNLDRGGVTAAPYTAPTWISTNAPEWQSHRSEWGGGTIDTSFRGSPWTGDFVNVCTARASWRDYAIERFTTFIDSYRLHAIYLDNAQLYPIHGCLYPHDRRALDFPILPQRAVFRAISEHLRRTSANTLAIVHSSGGMNAPSFSTADAWVNGEQYRGIVTDDYLKVASLTDFRVESNGAQWGFIPFFLPEFTPAQAAAVAPTRKLMSILLLHDIVPWPLWANVEEINRGLAMLDAYDASTAEFIPYYDEHPLAAVTHEGVYVSAYRRAHDALLIVSNLGDSAAVDHLCLLATGPDDHVQLTTWPDRHQLVIDKHCAAIHVDAGSYAMFRADAQWVRSTGIH